MQNSRQLAEQILSYLHERPEAADTLEGIARWWIHTQHIEESVQAVRVALQELKAEGVIAEQQTAGGRTLYRLLEAANQD